MSYSWQQSQCITAVERYDSRAAAYIRVSFSSGCCRTRRDNVTCRLRPMPAGANLERGEDRVGHRRKLVISRGGCASPEENGCVTIRGERLQPLGHEPDSLRLVRVLPIEKATAFSIPHRP